MATPPRSARDRLLETASGLFYREGIRAVGIDTIVDQSGVARMTLYRHFASKDELIAAYLQEQDRGYWQWFEQALGSPTASLRDRVLNLFAALGQALTDSGLRGCPFLNAAAEFPDPDHPAHRIAVAHKQELHSRLRALAEAVGVRDADGLAGQLVVLLNGAYSTASALGTAEPAATAGAAATLLIDAHLP